MSRIRADDVDDVVTERAERSSVAVADSETAVRRVEEAQEGGDVVDIAGSFPSLVSLDGVAPAHIVVLGAGVCGLYAARCLSRLGLRVTLLERESVVGGLAAGHARGRNFFDLGVHHLHAFDAEIFEDVRTLMGASMIAVEKDARIRYGRGFRRYPLEFFDLLTGIPPWTLFRALAGMVAQQARNRIRPRDARNAEEALVQLYGRPLYRFFFEDFTSRYWGMPPARLSAAFVRRKMPRLSAVDVVKKALWSLGLRDPRGATVDSALARETLYYGPTGSREMPEALARAVREAGGRVLTGCPVEAIEIEIDARPAGDGSGGPVGQRAPAARAVGVRYRAPGGQERRLACDGVISTIPINHLVGCLDPAPPAGVARAAAALRHRALVVYGLRVSRERLLDALYIYYRDRRFHRLAEPKLSGLVVEPPEHTILLAEVMCDVGDAMWSGRPEAVDALMDDLEAEGVLHRAEVVEMHRVQAEHAYPVFDLGFEEHLACIEEALAGIANLRSVGRQGGFCYPNMHVSMRMGAVAAAEVAAMVGAARGGAPGG